MSWPASMIDWTRYNLAEATKNYGKVPKQRGKSRKATKQRKVT